MLQRISNDPTLAIPYWDLALDGYMNDPCSSAIFDSQLMGNAMYV